MGCPRERGGWAQATSLGLCKPTEIQRTVIPEILAGRSVVMASHTGSGKTLGFLLPMARGPPRPLAPGSPRRLRLEPAADCTIPGRLSPEPFGPRQVHCLRATEAETAERARPKRPRAIVLEPTRELALQVRAARALGRCSLGPSAAAA